jgi:transglutaminase-like putative cysteine protease
LPKWNVKVCCVWNDFKRYWQISPAQRSLLWEAFAFLAIARIAMACVPFRRIAAWLGTPGVESPAAVTPENDRTAEWIGWAVSALGRRVPWDGRCLAQALAATAMLRRRGVEGTVSLGVCEGETAGFEAHAWLRVGSRVVTGGAGREQFKALTTFARGRS